MLINFTQNASEGDNMDRQLEVLVNEYCEIEDEIKKELSYLPEYGEECNCGSLDQVELRGSDGSEIFVYCMECGGYIYEHKLF